MELKPIIGLDCGVVRNSFGSFNRTSMELKLTDISNCILATVANSTFNRTSMELKLVSAHSAKELMRERLLIEPVWN